MSDLILDKYSIRDLVLMNPFRVLQLPVDATGQVIRKHQQKLRFDLSQSNWKGPKPICWPMSPPPTGSQIQEAFSKLDDPVVRFLAELFWYWPDASGEFTFGLGAWAKWPSKENGGAGPHNIALFHLFSAIQKTEALVHGGFQVPAPEGMDHWKEALSWWNRLLNKEEAVWHRLRARILEIGDPRLETDLIPTLRLTLIPSIEGVAINQLEQAFAGRDSEKWSFFLKSALTHQGICVLSHPRQLISIPTKELDRADQLIKSALARIAPVTEASKASIQQWIAEVKVIGSMLWILEEEAGLSSELSQDVRHARNDVLRKYINALRSIFIDYHNETLDRAACLAWLRLIDSWDIGGIEGGQVKADIEKVLAMQSEADAVDALKKDMESDKATIVEIADSQSGYSYWPVCCCCLKETQKMKTWTRSSKEGNLRITRKITLPYCQECENHEERLGVFRAKAIFSILAPAAGLAFILGLNGAKPEAGLLAGFCLGLILYLFARFKQWPKWSFTAEPMPPGHAHRGSPVEIIDGGFRIASISTSMTIRFTNSIYGRRFAELNNVKLTEINFCKYPKGTNIITGRSGRQIAGWATIGAAMAGWTLCGLGIGIRQANRDSSSTYRYQTPSAHTTEQPSVPLETRTYTPPPTYTPPTYSPPPDYTSPTPNYARTAEKSRIESMKSELRVFEAELESKKIDLDSLESQIQSARNSANLYASTGPEYLYNSEVDRHNTLLRRHESLRQDYNSYLSIYRMKLRTVNTAIDAYNRGN